LGVGQELGDLVRIDAIARDSHRGADLIDRTTDRHRFDHSSLISISS
jgi:hypothetical protein